MGFANAFEPCVNRLIVKLYAMVAGRFKLVGVEILNDTFLPARSDGLRARLSPCEDFNMHHVMLLLSQLLVVVDGAVEHQISWLHLFEF